MNLIFDATFSDASVGHLRSFFQAHRVPRPVFRHINDLGARDARDDVWIPRLLQEDCIVISGDRGLHAPRLPAICREHQKTHIIISGTLQKETEFVKLRAIVLLWPNIVRAVGYPKGTRFQIHVIGEKHEHFGWTQKA